MTEMPEDIATLYSRARMEWTRYWDFAASRKQVRRQLNLGAVREPLEWPLPALPMAAFAGQSGEGLSAAQTQEVEIEQPELQAPVTPEAPPLQITEVHAAELEPQEPEPMPQAAPGAATRWYALRSIFASAQPSADSCSFPALDDRPPILVVFSLAGGVGKTCLVATLGRLLSALGEHVLLSETAACGLLPFYFGSRELRPGVVRTFFPPGPFGEELDAPVQMLNLQGDSAPVDAGAQKPSSEDPLLSRLLCDGHGTSRIVVDVATASRTWMSRLLPLRPTLLVPILPDMSSVACLGLLESPAGNANSGEKACYLLNQFDAASPLHRDVRALLQQRLGERLLPFVLRRSSLVSEALAEGMTVIDYAPGSDIAGDYHDLTAWLRSLAAPATAGNSLRWSER